MILEKYEPITYNFPIDTVGLIATKDFLKNILPEFVKQGYKIKIGRLMPNFSE